MATEESISIEETNKIRISLGLKPIPLPKSDAQPELTKEDSQNNGSISISETNKLRLSLGLKPIPEPTTSELAQTPPLLSNEEQRITTEQYQQRKQSEEKNSAIRERLEMAKSKAANRRKLASAKSILDEIDDENNDDWLSKVGVSKKDSTTSTTSKKKTKNIKAKANTEGQDISGLRVAHNISDIQNLNQESVILTFKDQSIYEDGNELESELLSSKKRTEKQVQEKMNIKGTNEFGMEKHRLETYQDRLKEGEDEGFMLSNGMVKHTDDDEIDKRKPDHDFNPDKQQDTKRRKIQFSLDSDEEKLKDEETKDYAEAKPIKMKKLKKKSTSKDFKRKREAPTEPIEMIKVDLQDQDLEGDGFDIQSRLAKSRNAVLRRRKLKSPEELAKEIQEDKEEELKETIRSADVGLIYDENTEFLSSIKTEVAEVEAEEDKAQQDNTVNSKTETISPISVSQTEIETDSKTEEDPTQTLNFNGGLASTLSFLKSKHVVVEKSEKQKQQEQINEQHKKEMELRKIKFDIEARVLKEELEADEELMRLPKADREKIINQELDKLKDKHSLRSLSIRAAASTYNPDIKLQYHDEYGRELTSKEAYKELSHSFHGQALNKNKIEKRKKKVEEDREVKEREGRLLS